MRQRNPPSFCSWKVCLIAGFGMGGEAPAYIYGAADFHPPSRSTFPGPSRFDRCPTSRFLIRQERVAGSAND